MNIYEVVKRHDSNDLTDQERLDSDVIYALVFAESVNDIYDIRFGPTKEEQEQAFKILFDSLDEHPCIEGLLACARQTGHYVVSKETHMVIEIASNVTPTKIETFPIVEVEYNRY